MKTNNQANTRTTSKSKGRAKNIVIKTIGFSSAMIAGFSALYLGTAHHKYTEAQKTYDSIRNEIVTESCKETVNAQEIIDSYDGIFVSDTEHTPVSPETDLSADYMVSEEFTAPIEVSFDSLKEINEDICGWIYVEALPEISYPILKREDNDFYLSHDIYGQESISGSIFMDMNNKNDFSSMNTLIYGHNMKDGSMFASLKNFITDQSVYDRSKYIWILTPEKSLRYEIISAYTASIDNDAYSLFDDNFQEVAKTDASYTELYQTFLNVLKGYSAIQTNADMNSFTTDNRSLVLSTCVGDYEYRNVVTAVLTNP